MGRTVMVTLAFAAAVLGGCDARSLIPDGGGGGAGDGPAGHPGAGATGGSVIHGDPVDDKLSDFEDLAVATIVLAGSPPRHGTWYAYNDGSATCLQVPVPMTASDRPQLYIPEAPPTLAPGTTGSLALHARWSDCSTWGAGIGADISVPLVAGGGAYTGPKVSYDLTPYAGITFWAMATPGTDAQLRLKLPMGAETRIEDGGRCVEGVTFKCSDDWGEVFSLPANGNWKQVTVRFSDPLFQQEGWGAPFPWHASDVTSIQIQSVDRAETYDFWIDDVYLLR
jgi:hypothetical protein